MNPWSRLRRRDMTQAEAALLLWGHLFDDWTEPGSFRMSDGAEKPPRLMVVEAFLARKCGEVAFAEMLEAELDAIEAR